MEFDYSKVGGVIEEYKDSDFIGGTIPYEAVCDDWTPYLPKGERQKKRIETMSCVTFSALNVMETQLNFFLKTGKIADWAVKQLIELGYIENGQFNFSDRFTAKMSGTTDKGNTFQAVWDSIHHDGVLPEKDWQFGDNMTRDEYFLEPPQALKDKAKLIWNYLDEKLSKYEWALQNNVVPLAKEEFVYLNREIKQAPLHIATPVCNWDETPTPCGKYASEHAEMFYKIENGEKIEDQYEPFLKTLSVDYIIRCAMKSVVKLKDSVKKNNEENMVVNYDKLNQIYNEMLFRSADDEAAKSYVDKEEEFVRAEVGKSAERKSLIDLVNSARRV